MFEVGVGRFVKGVISYMHMHMYLNECRIITVLY